MAADESGPDGPETTATQTRCSTRPTSATSRAPSGRSASTTLDTPAVVAARLLTLLAIMGPGLIVMVGDNDAGGVSTYARPVRTSASPCCGPCPCSSRC